MQARPRRSIRSHRRSVRASHGVGVKVADSPIAVADFWRDGSGQLVMRFFSNSYDYHCQATLKSGGPIPEDQMEDFADWVVDVLFEWVIDGVDDDPEPIVD